MGNTGERADGSYQEHPLLFVEAMAAAGDEEQVLETGEGSDGGAVKGDFLKNRVDERRRRRRRRSEGAAHDL